MMLKLLIAACLVSHGLGRPDVSHILKQENQRQNDRAFHPLDYLSRQLGKGGEFEARAATASRSSPPIGGRRAGSRAFRNVVKPSPFKKNTAEFGYTYEKPSDPFDFPINPDANLIKPVSTQAPEYLPPVTQSPPTPADVQSSVSGISSSPSYPELVPGSANTERPQRPIESTFTQGSVASVGTSTSSPTPGSETPSFPGMSQSPQNGYSPPGPTSSPVDLTTGYQQGSTADDEFTGYPPASSPEPGLSSSVYPPESRPSIIPGSPVSTTFPQETPTSTSQQPESQVTTESGFTGYPPYKPSSESTPRPSPSSTDYPQTSSSLPGQQPSTTPGFTGYPESFSSTVSPDQDSGTTTSPTGYPQGPSEQPEIGFTGYPQGPSSTVSPGETSTAFPESETTTEKEIGGYPQGPFSPNATTESPITDSTPALLTTGGTQPGKPVLPPNLNEVLGEPFDINDLATTTQPTTTTTPKTADGSFIPPKPRPELVVPNEPSASPIPDQTERPATQPTQLTTQAALPGQPSSTSAPEYLPPDSDSPQSPQTGPSTTGFGTSESVTTEANYPSSSLETTTFAGYPSFDRDTTTSTRYPVVGQDTSTTVGYASQETTTFAGYPESDRETTTTSSYLGPNQEASTSSNYPSSDRDTTTPVSYPKPVQEASPDLGYPVSNGNRTTTSSYPSAGPETSTAAGYPSPDSATQVVQETTTATDFSSASQETTTSSRYPSEETITTSRPETTTFGGYPNAQGSTTTGAAEYTTVSTIGLEYSTGQPSTSKPLDGAQPYPMGPGSDQSSGPMSTAAPEYLPPEDDNSTSQYYPPATSPAVEFTSTPSSSVPEYRPEQPVRPSIPSDSQVNQTVPASPDYTEPPTDEQQPEQPETPINIMEMINAINGLVPGNSYLPPSSINMSDLRIVVDDTPSSDPIQTPPSSPSGPASEAEADGSEVQPRVALAESTSKGYNYQVPEERLPVPVIPSHTLDDEGYHYKIPKVPFLT